MVIKKHLLAYCLIMIWYALPASAQLTSNAKNDPYPVFSTEDPESFLTQRARMMLKGWPDVAIAWPEWFSFSASVFGQQACTGNDFYGHVVELGDLDKWNLFALTFGNLPAGASYGDLLTIARDSLLADSTSSGIQILNNDQFIDPNERFGFVSIPLKYRKLGLRFEMDGQLFCDFGFLIQAGIADICQSVSSFNIEATSASEAGLKCELSLDLCATASVLVTEIPALARELKLDICDFHKVGVEDVRANLYWRHMFEINRFRPTWPHFIITPFASIGVSLPSGKPRNTNVVFSLPFGNNGHFALGGSTGVSIDFVETVEISAHVGYTHFFEHTFHNYRVPNSPFQSGIYPFTTDVSIKPGFNWHFSAKLAAYRFLDRLSFYAQYVMIHHEKDRIQLACFDPAFHPEVLECKSSWKVQLINACFNYDISPNLSLGFLWQIPVNRRNAYRSNMVLFSLNAIF